MLYYETVEPKTLGLLKKLQKIPEFSDLRLVGGTALALQLGHRKSIDIDLFGNISADNITISKKLDKIGQVTILKNSKHINIYLIDNIKVDIVNYHYKWLENSIIENELILADKKDIAAMKIAAITGRGTKKDFIDLFFLLKHYKFYEIINFYKQKYHDGSLFMVLKSLLYFVDAEEDDKPEMIISEKWLTIREFIKRTVEKYIVNNKFK